MKSTRRGISAIEYMALTVFILTAMFVLQNYILRGFAGRWKASGDSFGHERQYDPTMTTECVFDQEDGRWETVGGDVDPLCNDKEPL